MKKIILSIIIGISAISLFAQDFSELSNTKFKSPEDYKKYQPQILESANYLFNNPFNKKDLNRSIAVQFILKWMEGSPNYTFNIGPEVLKITKGNSNLFSMYLAAMSMTVLTDPNKKLSDKQIQEKATQYMVDYTSKAKNNLKPSKALKKMIKKS